MLINKMSQKSVTFIKEDNTFIFECPHCDQQIQVDIQQTNCCIFRCGIYKHNNTQMNPHTPKEECDRVVRENLIYGCGKPFKFFKGDKPYVEPCDYI